MGKRVVIIGGVAGGMSAATRLRRLDESAEIVVVERGPHVSFANCGLPYYLSREIADPKKLLVQTPDRLRAVFNLDVRPKTEATAIRLAERMVELRDVANGQTSELHYDALVLSVGAVAIRPPVPGIDRPGHFLLRTIPDLEAIENWITDRSPRTAVVVGGGYIGLEAAEQLHRRGLQVTVVERLPQALAPFDPEMAAHIHLALQRGGVELILSDGVSGFESPTDGEQAAASVVTLASGRRLPADLVILSLGVKPETTLAKAAGLTIGPAGGIQVDTRLQTSNPHVWAVGDAIEVPHLVTGRSSLIALAGPANRQGRVAADNIAGLNSHYRGSLGTAVVRVFDQVAACVGANERQLREADIPYQAIHLHPNSHAGYYPGAKSIALKLIFAPNTGKLLGAQAISADGADKRIDVLATAIKAGLTVDDVAELELGYAPPFGSAKDPVNLAGMAAQNVLAGLVTPVQWHEVAAQVATGAIVLDVRDAKERESGLIAGSIHIPLGELRARVGELPRDRPILAHCASGQRSYSACRLLTQLGYQCRNLTGSFKTWEAARSGLPLTGGTK